MLYLLVVIFITLDFATGIVKAIKSKEFTSAGMREGLFHKCGSILCLVFGGTVNYAQTKVDLGVSIPILEAVCTYIILMECASIIENLGIINPSLVPAKLRKFFAKLP